MTYPTANIKITDEGISLDIIHSDDNIEQCGYIMYNLDSPMGLVDLLNKLDGKIMKIKIDGDQAPDSEIITLKNYIVGA